MSYFVGHLHFKDDGGFPFAVDHPFLYWSTALGRSISVPKGFKTDLASIPRILWNILPPVGRYDQAAVVHDKLYQFNSCTRSEADTVLLEAMEVLGVCRWQRVAIYLGVRLGGWIAWRHYRRGKSKWH